MAASLPLKRAIRSSTLMFNLSKSARSSASLSPSMNRRSLVTNSTDSKVPDSTDPISSMKGYRGYDYSYPDYNLPFQKEKNPDSKVPDSNNPISSREGYHDAHAYRFNQSHPRSVDHDYRRRIHNHEDTDDETDDDDLVEKFVTFPKSWQNYSVKTDESTLRIRMDMPGINKEDVNIDLEVDTNKLLIEGGAEIGKYDLENHIVENSDSDDEETGSRCYFSKVQLLPTRYKIDEIKANFDNGVLVITVPKMVGINPTLKRIQVA